MIPKFKGDSFRKERPIFTHFFNFFKIKRNFFQVIDFLRRYEFNNRPVLRSLQFSNFKFCFNSFIKSKITILIATITPNFKNIRGKRNAFRADTIHPCDVLKNFVIELSAGVRHCINSFKCFCSIFS